MLLGQSSHLQKERHSRRNEDNNGTKVFKKQRHALDESGVATSQVAIGYVCKENFLQNKSVNAGTAAKLLKTVIECFKNQTVSEACCLKLMIKIVVGIRDVAEQRQCFKLKIKTSDVSLNCCSPRHQHHQLCGLG